LDNIEAMHTTVGCNAKVDVCASPWGGPPVLEDVRYVHDWNGKFPLNMFALHQIVPIPEPAFLEELTATVRQSG
jgi:hypothetical protein